MKKFLFILPAAVVFSLLSCGGGGMSATAKKKKEVNAAIMKAYEAGEFSKMGDYIAKDAVDHGGETGDVVGLDNIISEMKRYRAMMPDMKATAAHEMADDDYVMTWATMSGTMNGKPVTMTSVDLSRFKDGKAVEHWVFMDPKELTQMMQPASQNPAADQTAPAADTTKQP